MCHFFQKMERLVEKYGLLKFSGVLIPIKYAVPIAISEYPEKSKRIYNEYKARLISKFSCQNIWFSKRENKNKLQQK